MDNATLARVAKRVLELEQLGRDDPAVAHLMGRMLERDRPPPCPLQRAQQWWDVKTRRNSLVLRTRTHVPAPDASGLAAWPLPQCSAPWPSIHACGGLSRIRPDTSDRAQPPVASWWMRLPQPAAAAAMGPVRRTVMPPGRELRSLLGWLALPHGEEPSAAWGYPGRAPLAAAAAPRDLGAGPGGASLPYVASPGAAPAAAPAAGRPAVGVPTARVPTTPAAAAAAAAAPAAAAAARRAPDTAAADSAGSGAGRSAAAAAAAAAAGSSAAPPSGEPAPIAEGHSRQRRKRAKRRKRAWEAGSAGPDGSGGTPQQPPALRALLAALHLEAPRCPVCFEELSPRAAALLSCAVVSAAGPFHALCNRCWAGLPMPRCPMCCRDDVTDLTPSEFLQRLAAAAAAPAPAAGPAPRPAGRGWR